MPITLFPVHLITLVSPAVTTFTIIPDFLPSAIDFDPHFW